MNETMNMLQTAQVIGLVLMGGVGGGAILMLFKRFGRRQ